ncbi:MAG: CooT family nickel-binding protein [Candidatus Bathyarchaeia archaeon]
MCEFKVFLDGEKVMEDVIFARSEGDRVVLRDIIGETATFEDVKILEVDVTTTSLILQRLKLGCPAR